MADFAVDRPLAAAPGTPFHYSTGTSVIISGIVAREIGAGEPYRRFLPSGCSIRSACDRRPGLRRAAGHLGGRVVHHATARDYARFALLYLRDGVWQDRRLLPEGWVDHGRQTRVGRPRRRPPLRAHWWTRDEPLGTFWAAGHEGQYVDISPALDLVLVRLGRDRRRAQPGVAGVAGRGDRRVQGDAAGVIRRGGRRQPERRHRPQSTATLPARARVACSSHLRSMSPKCQMASATTQVSTKTPTMTNPAVLMLKVPKKPQNPPLSPPPGRSDPGSRWSR